MVVMAVVAACNFNPQLLGTTRCGEVLCSGDWVCSADEVCIPPIPIDAGSSTEAVCGDGVIGGDEACDDGDDRDDDACTNACQWAVCGDGIVRRGVEDCEPPTPSCDPTVCLVTSAMVWPENAHIYELQAILGGGFQGARNDCQARGPGYHLATLDLEYEAVHAAFAASAYWIGLTDVATEGDMLWITGEPSGVFHFGLGQPDDQQNIEDCVEERVDPMLWNDLGCDHDGLAGLCEHDDPLLRAVDHHAYAVSWSPVSRDSAILGCSEAGMALASIADDGELQDMLGLPFRGDFRVANPSGASCQALHRDVITVSLVDVDCLSDLPALCEAD
jgi:hypothetical protein